MKFKIYPYNIQITYKYKYSIFTGKQDVYETTFIDIQTNHHGIHILYVHVVYYYIQCIMHIIM